MRMLILLQIEAFDLDGDQTRITNWHKKVGHEMKSMYHYYSNLGINVDL